MSNETIGWENIQAERVKQDVAESNGHLGLCNRCGGTGNELYAMYRKCSSCDGVGAVELVTDND